MAQYELGTILMALRREQEVFEHFEKHRAASPDFKPTLRRIAALTHRIARRSVQAMIVVGSSLVLEITSVWLSISMLVA
jgi:hypothetical protein